MGAKIASWITVQRAARPRIISKLCRDRAEQPERRREQYLQPGPPRLHESTSILPAILVFNTPALLGEISRSG